MTSMIYILIKPFNQRLCVLYVYNHLHSLGFPTYSDSYFIQKVLSQSCLYLPCCFSHCDGGLLPSFFAWASVWGFTHMPLWRQINQIKQFICKPSSLCSTRHVPRTGSEVPPTLPLSSPSTSFMNRRHLPVLQLVKLSQHCLGFQLHVNMAGRNPLNSMTNTFMMNNSGWILKFYESKQAQFHYAVTHAELFLKTVLESD